MRTRTCFSATVFSVLFSGCLFLSCFGQATAGSSDEAGQAGGAIHISPDSLFPGKTTETVTDTGTETGPFMNLTVGGMRAEIQETGVATVYIQFATNSSEIMPESRPQVESITTLLTEEPAWCLNIVGHTDSTGDSAYNQELSRKRAASVQQELLNGGIGPDRLQAEGMGSGQPVADNKTREGRSRNRRVELVKQDCP